MTTKKEAADAPSHEPDVIDLLKQTQKLALEVKQLGADRDAKAQVYGDAVAAHKNAAVKLQALQAQVNEVLGGVIGAAENPRFRVG